jgi:2-haloacid dehalogenase
VPLNRDMDVAVELVMDGFSNLSTHSDVPDGVRALRATRRRLVTLSNGSAQVAERLLTSAGIADEFEAFLSVEDAGTWKPARAAYEYAARRCDTLLHEMLLVAAHPWDIDGAARAGMGTAWINRSSAHYPTHMTAPDYTITFLGQLAEILPK